MLALQQALLIWSLKVIFISKLISLFNFYLFFYLESIFPPVFGRRLQAQVVKKGERVIMDVEITGTPEPQITWYKDDRLLDQTKSNDFKFVQVGNCYKLIFDNGLKNYKSVA